MNGSYQFRGQGDIEFDPANPRSYPERLTIRVLGPSEYKMKMHVGEFFAQDKWQMKPGLTLSAGVRYDIEVFPYEQDPGNPLFSGRSRQYPIDTNNIAPRLGLVWNPDGESKSVVRVGYGMFYDRTLLGTVDNFLTDLQVRSRRSWRTSRRRARTPARATGGSPPIRRLNSGDVSRLTPAVRAYINSRVSARNDRAELRHGHVGRSEPGATILPSVQCGIRARGVYRRLGICRLHPHVRP